MHKKTEAHPDTGCASAALSFYQIISRAAAAAVGAENTMIILRIFCGEKAYRYRIIPANCTIATLSLAEKVKRVKNYVFYIECSNK